MIFERLIIDPPLEVAIMKMAVALILSGFLGLGTVFAMSQFSKDEIKIPGENYMVEIVDIDGIKTLGENVTFDSDTIINVRRGSTEVFIPFEMISAVEMVNNEEVITKELKEIGMLIHLKDGSNVEVTGKSHFEITGESQFGRFRVRLDRVRNLSILKKVPPKETSHQ